MNIGTKEYKTTSNSTVYRRLRRRGMTSCSFCPPHGGENKRRKKHAVKKSYQLNPKRGFRQKIRSIL